VEKKKKRVTDTTRGRGVPSGYGKKEVGNHELRV